MFDGKHIFHIALAVGALFIGYQIGWRLIGTFNIAAVAQNSFSPGT